MADVCDHFDYTEGATCLRSSAITDAEGLLMLNSGLLIKFLRGNQKSGLWDTSVNNKVVNSAICCALVMCALNIEYDEIVNRVVIKIEGDDGIIIAEECDAILIDMKRDEIYSNCGFPQVTSQSMVYDIEEIEFCSVGVTKLQTHLFMDLSVT
jgi:hypothetical protein